MVEKPYDPWDLTDRRHGGQPPVEIDLDEVRKLASLGCTLKEIGRIAANMNDKRFLDLRNRRPEIEEAIEEGRANLQKSIRVAQVKSGVQDGNVQMLIHLGKHYLDQREKMDVNQTVNGGMVIETEFRKTEPAEESETA